MCLIGLLEGSFVYKRCKKIKSEYPFLLLLIFGQLPLQYFKGRWNLYLYYFWTSRTYQNGTRIFKDYCFPSVLPSRHPQSPFWSWNTHVIHQKLRLDLKIWTLFLVLPKQNLTILQKTWILTNHNDFKQSLQESEKNFISWREIEDSQDEKTSGVENNINVKKIH